MILRMACPTKRPGSDNWYFRKRIPADVQAILAKLPKGQRPASWYKDQISISLRTADRSIAKARCPDVAAQVERTMATLRAGPKPLDVKQISALSGELYVGLAEALEGKSVVTAAQWSRVAEMIQLRKQDIRKDPANGWIIRLTPEAGSIKNNKFCDVPVHEHLIATGFIDFINSAKAGYLFCDPTEDGTIEGPAGGVYKRVYEMAREVVPSEVRQPNHAWRYTFKTYGLEVGIELLTLNAISNHAPRTQGEMYTKVTLKTRAEAMKRFPRYSTG